jgi:putative phage-type endonuclease
MTTFTTEDRIIAEKNGSFTVNVEPIPFAGLVTIDFPERLVAQGSDEWKAVRLGHVSASCVADVMAKGKGGAESITRRKYKMRLVAERLTGQGQESFSNSAMEWGNEQESFARQAYEVSRETFVDKTGFWKHPTIKWLGVSPDGLVNSDGLVEIKCPNSTTHLDYLIADQVPSEYYKQMQCQMWVTNRLWCDFVSYDPRIKLAKNRLFVKRCMRDDVFLREMEVEVLQFLKEVQDLYDNLNGAENE